MQGGCMISIDFTKLRAQRTRDAQNTLATIPAPGVPWISTVRTVLQWDTGNTELDQAIIAESLKRTQLRNAAAFWQNDVDEIARITRQVAALGQMRFRNDPSVVLFESLTTDSRARMDVYADGLMAHGAWGEADASWVVKLSETENMDHGGFGSLLAACLARQATHSAKFNAWRLAASVVMTKAQKLDQDCITWYEEATRIFAEGTAYGDMIRTSVPTTTRAAQPVGPGVITSVMASGGDIHVDAAAEHATKYTFLHQPPGSPIFLVVVTDSPENHLTLHNQPPGVHRFKASGSNSDGDGPEGAVVEVTVAQQAAA
jgi:hypothetical protein